MTSPISHDFPATEITLAAKKPRPWQYRHRHQYSIEIIDEIWATSAYFVLIISDSAFKSSTTARLAAASSCGRDASDIGAHRCGNRASEPCLRNAEGDRCHRRRHKSAASPSMRQPQQITTSKSSPPARREHIGLPSRIPKEARGR